MEDIILAGSGGCMRELVWQIQLLNEEEQTWNILGYVDNEKPLEKNGVTVGGQQIPYLGNDDILLRQNTDVNVAICVGTPSLRKKIAEKLQVNPYIHFPNLILGNVKLCTDMKMGKGCILSMGTQISTNVSVGDFVFLNIGSGVCHDGRLENFVTLSPDVRLAGNVTIEEGCDIGLGTKVIQGIHIGKHTITGAGSVVVADISGDCVVAGVPAKELKRK